MGGQWRPLSPKAIPNYCYSWPQEQDGYHYNCTGWGKPSAGANKNIAGSSTPQRPAGPFQPQLCEVWQAVHAAEEEVVLLSSSWVDECRVENAAGNVRIKLSGSIYDLFSNNCKNLFKKSLFQESPVIQRYLVKADLRSLNASNFTTQRW